MLRKLPMTLKAWLMAIRIRTLPIPTIQVLTGTGLAYALMGSVNWILALYTLLVAIFITIGTNLINDVIDFEKGGDPLTRFGHMKVIRAGLLTKQQVYVGGLLALALALLISIPLSLQVGWGLFAIVLLSALMAYCYTGGPYPICYLGLSELFIFLFYGCVCVIAAYYVQSGHISGEAVLLAIQMGLLAILPNALNNFRDMFDDAEVNKRTLAVRFGRKFARLEIAFLTIAPFILNFIWLFLGYVEAAMIPLLLIPIAFIFVRSIWTTEPGPIFNRYFGLSVAVQFLFGLLLTIGLLLA